MSDIDDQVERIDSILSLPRSTLWDGAIVQMPGSTMPLHYDASEQDWAHRICYRQFNSSSNELTLIREISKAQARALGAKRFYPGRTLEVAVADVVRGKIVEAIHSPAVARGRSVFSMLDGHELTRARGRSEEPLMIDLIANMLADRYEWRVRFRAAPGQLSATIPTDPVGAREAFKLRDLPEGRSRRTALRNWVRSHWRSKRPASDPELVQAHLRGETNFNWNGMECELLPSQFDRELEVARNASSGRRRA
jgi:hypothetical protein